MVNTLAFETLRAVVADKPDPYERADLDEGREIFFSALRDAMPRERAETAIAAVNEIVRAEVEMALMNAGVHVDAIAEALRRDSADSTRCGHRVVTPGGEGMLVCALERDHLIGEHYHRTMAGLVPFKDLLPRGWPMSATKKDS